MESMYNFLIVPKLARNIINRGRGWSLLLSLMSVWAASVCLAFFADANGCRYIGIMIPDEGHNLFVSLFNSLFICILFWMAFTVFVTMRRATIFKQLPSIDIEAQCFSLPFAFILPGIVLIKGLTSAMNPKFIIFYSNVLVICVLVNLLVIGHLLITERGNLKSLGNASSRNTARLFRMQMLGHKHSGLTSLLIATGAIIIGAACVGYHDILSIMPSLSPVARMLKWIELSILFWITASWVVGRYRVYCIGDNYGMKTAVAAFGWSIARFYIVICTALLVSDITNWNQLNVNAGLDTMIFRTVVLLATALASADVFLTLNSMLTLSSRYAPTIDNNTDTIGVILSNKGSDSAAKNNFEATLEAIGKIELPSWRAAITSIWGLVTVNINMFQKLDLTGSSPQSLVSRCVGVSLLPISALIHGVTLDAHLKPVFGHFANLSIYDIDLPVGIGSFTLYITLMVVTLYLLVRLLEEKLSLSAICALAGFSMVPLSFVMLLCTLLPENMRLGASEILYPVAIIWAFGFIVLYTGLISIQRKRVFIALPAVIVIVLLTHLLANQLIWKAHMSLMEVANVPVIKICDRIADEAPPSSRSDVIAATNRLENVDLVSMRAADLVQYVLCVEKVSQRFYGYMPDEMLQARISNEVTNGKWMQMLTSRMAQVTGHAKNPDDAARLVFDWIKSEVTNVQPATIPFGEKFNQDPITTLKCRQGDQMDVAILMVAALRASGVAARISDVWLIDYATAVYSLAEYFDGEQWKPCYPWFGRVPKPKLRTSSRDMAFVMTWLSKIPEAKIYMLSDGIWKYCADGNEIQSLPPGTYLTSYVTGNTCHMRQFVLGTEK